MCPIDQTQMVEVPAAHSLVQAEQHDRAGIVSWLVLYLSLCAVGAVVVVTNAWYDVVAVQPDTWGALIFDVLAGFVGVGSILFVVIPSAILYRRKRRRLDLVSLCIAIICLLALCAEFVVLFFIPLKPGSPAG